MNNISIFLFLCIVLFFSKTESSQISVEKRLIPMALPFPFNFGLDKETHPNERTNPVENKSRSRLSKEAVEQLKQILYKMRHTYFNNMRLYKN